MRNRKEEARAKVYSIKRDSSINRLRVTLSEQRREDIAAIVKALLGNTLFSSDGAEVAVIVDVLMSDWDRRAKYIKCRVLNDNYVDTPNFIYYPVKSIIEMKDTRVLAAHDQHELLATDHFAPSVVRAEEIFPLVSLTAYAEHYGVVLDLGSLTARQGSISEA